MKAVVKYRLEYFKVFSFLQSLLASNKQKKTTKNKIWLYNIMHLIRTYTIIKLSSCYHLSLKEKQNYHSYPQNTQLSKG